MNINASIIEQRVNGLAPDLSSFASDELGLVNDAPKLRSLSFLYLCVATVLDLTPEEAQEGLTDGSGDFGVDAVFCSEPNDGEFLVTLFQSKFKQSLDANSNFEENAVEKLINAIRYIFDPNATLGPINLRLKTKVESIRSLIRDGVIPNIRAILCNNGLKWNESAQIAIDRTGFAGRVSWEHVNHDTLVKILQKSAPVSETIKLTGKAIIEDMNFSRVCVGRIDVVELHRIMKTHGEKLLERNIRRYLGLLGNRVNESIKNTLEDSDLSTNFYFFNNGLTLVCSDFNYNAFQDRDFQLQVENLQIVNGGQSSMTILKTLEELAAKGEKFPRDASVLVRLYKLPKESEHLVMKITHATNSQNPVDLKDLVANDKIQITLGDDMKGLGYNYRRKRSDSPMKADEDITSGALAEAVFATWRSSPQLAKFKNSEHFGKFYSRIFTPELNGAQAVSAVLLYRIAENRRKRPLESDPPLVSYASCFLAMQMGKKLLSSLGVDLKDLNHRNFLQAKKIIEENGQYFLRTSIAEVDDALKKLYVDPPSLQMLSATFRRGDLVEKLP